MLKLSGKFEFAPYVIERVLPKRIHLHKLSLVEMSELIGWPIKKTRNFFGGHRNPHWEDITYVCNILSIPIDELVEGMARYLMPSWREEQDKYIKSLNRIKADKEKLGKEYGKTLNNMILGRYPVHLQ